MAEVSQIAILHSISREKHTSGLATPERIQRHAGFVNQSIRDYLLDTGTLRQADNPVRLTGEPWPLLCREPCAFVSADARSSSFVARL